MHPPHKMPPTALQLRSIETAATKQVPRLVTAIGHDRYPEHAGSSGPKTPSHDWHAKRSPLSDPALEARNSSPLTDTPQLKTKQTIKSHHSFDQNTGSLHKTAPFDIDSTPGICRRPRGNKQCIVGSAHLLALFSIPPLGSYDGHACAAPDSPAQITPPQIIPLLIPFYH